MTAQMRRRVAAWEGDRWMDRAACRDKPARWFTDPGGPDDVRRALETCGHCPVRGVCLDVVLRHPVDADVGVWGGTTERTRRQVRIGRTNSPPDVATDRPHQHRHEGTGEVAEDDEDLGERPPINMRRTAAVERLAAPEITVARDAHGDFTDVTGRVIIFRIHGSPPWMLMIDRHCIARTETVADARRIAGTTLHPSQRSVTSRAVNHEGACPPVRR
jgi:hypothetical protein